MPGGASSKAPRIPTGRRDLSEFDLAEETVGLVDAALERVAEQQFRGQVHLKWRRGSMVRAQGDAREEPRGRRRRGYESVRGQAPAADSPPAAGGLRVPPLSRSSLIPRPLSRHSLRRAGTGTGTTIGKRAARALNEPLTESTPSRVRRRRVGREFALTRALGRAGAEYVGEELPEARGLNQMSWNMVQELTQQLPDLSTAESSWGCVELCQPEQVVLPIHHVKGEIAAPGTSFLLVNICDSRERLAEFSRNRFLS